MISPQEIQREEFWELAEEIGMTDIQTNNRSFFQRFFRKNDEFAGEE
jgi:hypothetical protein